MGEFIIRYENLIFIISGIYGIYSLGYAIGKRKIFNRCFRVCNKQQLEYIYGKTNEYDDVQVVNGRKYYYDTSGGRWTPVNPEDSKGCNH